MKKNNNKKDIIRQRMPRRKKTFGQKAADKLTSFCGSWFFIIVIFVYFIVWILLNITAFVFEWDPWPFIILNLSLSFLAVLQASIILMSQNRMADVDRLTARRDYLIDRKSGREIQEIKAELKEIKKILKKLK